VRLFVLEIAECLLDSSASFVAIGSREFVRLSASFGARGSRVFVRH
jgi:hypothetical protein